jgi:hypothetical protein
MGAMRHLFLVSVGALAIAGASAQKHTAPELITLANVHSPELRSAIEASFDEKTLKEGTASLSRGPEFFFAVESASEPHLIIDDTAGPGMTQLPGTQVWYGSAHIEPVSRLHEFHYMIGGAKFGGRLDLPAYGPLSYLKPSTPTGKLPEAITHTSKLYDGMKSDYSIYVPAGTIPRFQRR